MDDIETLYTMEKKLYEVGMRYIEQQIYYPGFFYVLGYIDTN